MSGAGRGRDGVIDVLRGACIVSMVLSHLAGGSGVSLAVHSPRWINGATGFVLLSGLVIGMVQRRLDEPAGLRKLARRARLVYLWHVGLVVLALTLAPWRDSLPGRPPMPTADQVGGWPVALLRVVTLQLNPTLLDVLSLYVVLFAVAAGALALLRRGLLWVAVASSALLWLVALATRWGELPGALGREPGFNPLAWQALFVAGLVLGWHWRTWSLGPVARRRLWAGAAATAVVCFVLARVVAHQGYAQGDGWGSTTVALLIGRQDLGPVRLLLGLAYLAALYPLLRRGWDLAPIRWSRAVLDPIGRHSLDSFVVMTVVLIVLPTLWSYDARGWTGVVVAALTLGLAWTWARWRDVRGTVRAPARAPGLAAEVTTPVG